MNSACQVRQDNPSELHAARFTMEKSPCDETLALVQLRLSGAGGALKDVGIRETLGQRLPRFQRMSVPFTIISCYFLVPLCAIQELFLV